MSKKSFTNALSNTEIQSNSISTLSNRPNDSIAYGGNGMSAVELKARFDALTKKLIEKTNVRWELFNTAGEDGISGYIPITTNTSLADMVDSFDSGAFATQIMVTNPDNETEALQTRLNALFAAITDVEAELELHESTYKPATDDTYITTNTDGELTLTADTITSLEHADTCDANVQADWNSADTTSDAYIKNKPNLGTASAKDVGTAQGNLVELVSGGKLPTSVLPAIAISDVFTVDSEAAMLALTAQRGDICIRTDETTTYILSTDSPATKADWKALQFPSSESLSSVASVNGQTGVVVLSASDVGAASLSQLATKQDVLTAGSNITITDNTISVDTMAAPIADNTKPITAGGVFTALSSKVDSSSLKTVATSGSYNDLLNKPTIPTTVAGLTDGADYVKSADLAAVATSGSYNDLTDKPANLDNCYTEAEVDAKLALKADTSILTDVATSGSYDDLTDKPTIPSNTSDLTNDSGFITEDDIPASNVQISATQPTDDNVSVWIDTSTEPTITPVTLSELQTNYYNKTEVSNLISSLSSIDFEVVTALPTTGEDNLIYLIADSQSANNIYKEYIWVNNAWELIGSTAVDLTNYYNKTEADGKFALSTDIPTKTSDLTNDSNFITNSVEDLTNYYDKDTTDENVTKAKDELLSMGEQLIINGSALMGDNTNFSSFAFDGSQANGSAGSFTKSGSSTNTVTSDKLTSLNPAYKYVFEIDAKTLNGISTTYAYINYMDIDKTTIMTRNTKYFDNTLTTLSQDLNNGDTIVHLTDLTNWNVNTGNASIYRGFIFWNYKNSYGYQYPAETYSRNDWYDLYIDTNVDKTNNTITLTNPWNHGTIPAGTQLSQHKGGIIYFYVGIRGEKVPQQWTHYKSIIDSIPAGTAFAKLGFLLFYNNTASDQIWFTNISLRRAIESSEVVGLSDEIPTKTSDLTNDSEYQTATQVTAAITSAIGTTSNLLGDTEDLT